MNPGHGLSDHIDDNGGLGEHRYVAACHLDDSRSHALRNPALEIGMHGVVLRGQHIPARLRLPRNAIGAQLLLVEQIEDGCIMG